MSNYNPKPIILPSLVAQEKKAARKRILEGVRARRKEIYTQLRKRGEEAYTNLEENS